MKSKERSADWWDASMECNYLREEYQGLSGLPANPMMERFFCFLELISDVAEVCVAEGTSNLQVILHESGSNFLAAYYAVPNYA